VQRIHCGAVVCPHCGFSLESADQSFVSKEIRTTTLSDSAGLLRLIDRHRVQKCVQKFSHRFPQFFFAINILTFAYKTDLRLFSFWLLNRAVFSDLAPDQNNAAAILLVMDDNHKLASLTFGYALDPYLDEQDTSACLQRAQSLWMENQFADGIIALVKQLEAILIRKHRRQKKKPAATREEALTAEHSHRCSEGCPTQCSTAWQRRGR
jgi:uncharacterized membrane protein YgcG